MSKVDQNLIKEQTNSDMILLIRLIIFMNREDNKDKLVESKHKTSLEMY
jgi:hypothetical protein